MKMLNIIKVWEKLKVYSNQNNNNHDSAFYDKKQI